MEPQRVGVRTSHDVNLDFGTMVRSTNNAKHLGNRNTVDSLDILHGTHRFLVIAVALDIPRPFSFTG